MTAAVGLQLDLDAAAALSGCQPIESSVAVGTTAYVVRRIMMDLMGRLRTTSPADRRPGLTLTGGYCIVAGLSEIWVGITGNWLGILSTPLKPSFRTALVGACYVAAGISLLSKRRTGALLSIVFILLEVVGRVHLVRIGNYPSKGPDAVKSVVGGVIALFLAGYVANQCRKFD